MIEKMCEFNLTLEEFRTMISTDMNRTFEVCKIIELVGGVKKNVILKLKKDKYKELLIFLEEYYKKYNIGEAEIIKDKIYLNNLKTEMNDYNVREIERFY